MTATRPSTARVPRRALLLLALLTLLASDRAGAQSVALSLGGGAAIGLGRLGEAFPHGAQLTAGVRLGPIAGPMSVSLDGTFTSLGADRYIVGDPNLSTRLASLTAGLSFSPRAWRVRPYGLVGAGITRRSAGGAAPAPAVTSLDLTGAGGAETNLGRFIVYAEARYRRFGSAVEDDPPFELLLLSLGLRWATWRSR